MSQSNESSHTSTARRSREFVQAVREGNKRVIEGSGCCGKPLGCTMTHKGCRHLRHPAKRADAFGELVCWQCGSPVAVQHSLCDDCGQRWAEEHQVGV